MYVRLEECIRCALKEDAVYTSIRNEESLIIDSYLESRQLKRVEIPADGFCMISAWLTCLEALGLKKERDDLIEEAREYMLANANFTLHKDQINNDLDRYKSTGDFASETVDQLPLALCNITKTKCEIVVVSVQEGIHVARSFTLTPTNGFQHEIVVTFLSNSLHYDVVLTEEQFRVHKEKENIEVIAIESDGDETILEVNEDYLIKTLRRKPVRELKSLALKNSIDISQALEKSDIIRSLMNNQAFKTDFSNETGKNFCLKTVSFLILLYLILGKFEKLSNYFNLFCLI